MAIARSGNSTNEQLRFLESSTSSKTGVRAGELLMNGFRIPTPVLWLGHDLEGSPPANLAGSANPTGGHSPECLPDTAERLGQRAGSMQGRT
jgi:hypothetical protein